MCVVRGCRSPVVAVCVRHSLSMKVAGKVLSLAGVVLLIVLVAGALITHSTEAEAQTGTPIPDKYLPGLDGCWPIEHNHNGHASWHVHARHRVTGTTNDGRTYTHCVMTGGAHAPIPTEPPDRSTKNQQPESQPAGSYGVQPVRPLNQRDCVRPPGGLKTFSAGVGGLTAHWQAADSRCRYTVQYAYYVFDDSHCEDGRWDDCLPTLGSQIAIGSATTTGEILDASIPDNRRIAAVRVSGSDRWSAWEYVDEPDHPSRRYNYCQNFGIGRGEDGPLRSRCVPNPSGGKKGVECDIARKNNGQYSNQTNRDDDENGVPDLDPKFGQDCVGTMNFNPCMSLTGVCSDPNSPTVRQEGTV